MAPEEYIEKIKQMVADGQLAKDVAEKYFPELIKKVSEDERVLNEIIEYLKALRTTAFSLNQSYIFLEEWIAWLEKQAEQKPVEWGEEDEINLQWLETICERLHYKNDPQVAPDAALNLKEWLKSLRRQNHWKPSEEQINVLSKATTRSINIDDAEVLRTLLEQLKVL